MARYLLIALNSPTAGEGHEAEYNEWYNEKHKPDLLSIEGAESVRRFKIVRRNRIDKDYIAITEFEADDPDTLMQALSEKASDFTDKIDRETSIFVLAEEIDTGT